MIRKVLILSMMVFSLMADAQSRNEIYTLKFNDLTYTVPDSKATAGEVIGTVLETMVGSASNKKHPELAPGISNMLKAALSDVLRLDMVTDNPMYEISGNIDRIYTNITVDDDDAHCRAEIDVTLTLTEVATGQQWTHSFSGGRGLFDIYISESKAEQNAIKGLCKSVVNYYNNMFPLEANIAEQGKAKKDKLQEVYIDLGSSSGVCKGQKLNVYRNGTVAGKESRVKLGAIKIEEVMGDEVSRCKVTDGHKKIKSALDNGETLLVVSTH